ncbi:GerW family sporulation protein [Oscillospiraceae bacterium 38-13]
MDNTMDKKHPVGELMRSTIDKIHELVDTNAIVGQPIHTPDGVTLIPISRVNFGFGSGGVDYGKSMKGENFGGGGGAGVKIDPVAFLVIRDGVTRVLPVAVPPVSTVDRVVDMAPDILDKVERFLEKRQAEKAEETL